METRSNRRANVLGREKRWPSESRDKNEAEALLPTVATILSVTINGNEKAKRDHHAAQFRFHWGGLAPREREMKRKSDSAVVALIWSKIESEKNAKRIDCTVREYRCRWRLESDGNRHSGACTWIINQTSLNFYLCSSRSSSLSSSLSRLSAAPICRYGTYVRVYIFPIPIDVRNKQSRALFAAYSRFQRRKLPWVLVTRILIDYDQRTKLSQQSWSEVHYQRDICR